MEVKECVLLRLKPAVKLKTRRGLHEQPLWHARLLSLASEMQLSSHIGSVFQRKQTIASVGTSGRENRAVSK